MWRNLVQNNTKGLKWTRTMKIGIFFNECSKLKLPIIKKFGGEENFVIMAFFQVLRIYGVWVSKDFGLKTLSSKNRAEEQSRFSNPPHLKIPIFWRKTRSKIENNLEMNADDIYNLVGKSWRKHWIKWRNYSTLIFFHSVYKINYQFCPIFINFIGWEFVFILILEHFFVNLLNTYI